MAPSFDGAPPPVPPAVATRDDRGRVSLRATRLGRALQIDGRITFNSSIRLRREYLPGSELFVSTATAAARSARETFC